MEIYLLIYTLLASGHESHFTFCDWNFMQLEIQFLWNSQPNQLPTLCGEHANEREWNHRLYVASAHAWACCALLWTSKNTIQALVKIRSLDKLKGNIHTITLSTL
jgi:hypothetical protein